MTGFEPATSCSQSTRATKLRHIPGQLNSTFQHEEFLHHLTCNLEIFVTKVFSGSLSRHRGYLWGCRIVAITPAFQAGDAGSIPVIPSNRTLIWIQGILVGVLRVFAGIPGFPG